MKCLLLTSSDLNESEVHSDKGVFGLCHDPGKALQFEIRKTRWLPYCHTIGQCQT